MDDYRLIAAAFSPEGFGQCQDGPEQVLGSFHFPLDLVTEPRSCTCWAGVQ